MDKTDKCPFCGSDLQSVVKNKYYDGKYVDYHVMCQECGTCGPSEPTEEEAVESWNRRFTEE